MTTEPELLSYEIKFAQADLSNVALDGTFEGYASLFGEVDMARDIVAPGAFLESIARRGARGIRMLFQHDPSEPIGVWTAIAEDRRGLFVRGRLATEVARAREVLSLMRAGALDGLSIGFKTVRGRSDRRSGIRRLEKVELWEISIVTFPMLAGARITAVKQDDRARDMPTKRECERWLTREAGLSRSQARAVIAKAYRAIAAMQDAAGRPHTAPAPLAARIREAARAMKPIM